MRQLQAEGHTDEHEQVARTLSNETSERKMKMIWERQSEVQNTGQKYKSELVLSLAMVAFFLSAMKKEGQPPPPPPPSPNSLGGTDHDRVDDHEKYTVTLPHKFFFITEWMTMTIFFIA